MSVTVNDQFTLGAAFAARDNLELAAKLIKKAESLISKAEGAVDIEVYSGPGLEDAQCAAELAANEIHDAIGRYSRNEDGYGEGLEITGRV